MWPAAAICHFIHQKRLSVRAKTEKLPYINDLYTALYEMPQIIFVYQSLCVNLNVIILVWLKMGLRVHIAQWQKYISASQLHILYSTYHCEFVSFQLLCQWSLVHSFPLTAVISVSEWEWFYRASSSQACFKFQPVFCRWFMRLSVWPVILKVILSHLAREKEGSILGVTEGNRISRRGENVFNTVNQPVVVTLKPLVCNSQLFNSTTSVWFKYTH